MGHGRFRGAAGTRRRPPPALRRARSPAPQWRAACRRCREGRRTRGRRKAGRRRPAGKGGSRRRARANARFAGSPVAALPIVSEGKPPRTGGGSSNGRTGSGQTGGLALGAWRLALGAWRLALNSHARVDNADTSSPDDAPGPLMRTPAHIGRRMITTACPAVSTAGFPGSRSRRPRNRVNALKLL